MDGPYGHQLRGCSLTTSAEFLGFLTPSPLVSILDQSIVLESRNLPLCIRFWETPSLPLSADVIYEWPLTVAICLRPESVTVGGEICNLH